MDARVVPETEGRAMTAIDTSPEAVERIASIIVKPLSTLKESCDAAALLRALDSERSALQRDLEKARELLREAPDWEPISTLDMSDDLIWLCRGDTVEGPRPPQVDDYDYWDWWCYAESPPLPDPDSEDKGASP